MKNKTILLFSTVIFIIVIFFVVYFLQSCRKNVGVISWPFNEIKKATCEELQYISEYFIIDEANNVNEAIDIVIYGFELSSSTFFNLEKTMLLAEKYEGKVNPDTPYDQAINIFKEMKFGFNNISRYFNKENISTEESFDYTIFSLNDFKNLLASQGFIESCIYVDTIKLKLNALRFFNLDSIRNVQAVPYLLNIDKYAKAWTSFNNALQIEQYEASTKLISKTSCTCSECQYESHYRWERDLEAELNDVGELHQVISNPLPVCPEAGVYQRVVRFKVKVRVNKGVRCYCSYWDMFWATNSQGGCNDITIEYKIVDQLQYFYALCIRPEEPLDNPTYNLDVRYIDEGYNYIECVDGTCIDCVCHEGGSGQ
jgi:hypothetical protein